MKYSLIIPVYNRPDEVGELLESLTHQTVKDFEVLVVEDGSQKTCQQVVEQYSELDVRYFRKPNSGPGLSRNYGAERAKGEFLVVLDSDCVLPAGYLQAVEEELQREDSDAFGGPDRAHESFTPVQKAINYSMTSFFTTGGIRGGKKKMDKFYPRSFNMGIRSTVYQALGGFSPMRFGEDIDFSIRIFKGGYKCRLFPEAWVWHKRRTDFVKFYRQVYNSGIARIHLYKKYPDSLKLVHLLPSVFTLGVTGLVLLFLVSGILAMAGFSWGCWLAGAALLPILLYSALVGMDSSLQNKSIRIGLLSVEASFIQLFGYGMGFIQAWWVRCVREKAEFSAFEHNFYK